MISKQDWINDHLDLYLYAKKIGDQEWIASILHNLENAEKLFARDLIINEQQYLWNEFLKVNEQILYIYKKIHDTKPGSIETENMVKKIMGLRGIRRSLLKRINDNNIKKKKYLLEGN